MINIDEVVKLVKTIVDNSRCVTCDKLSGDRLRYACGHTACGECVTIAEECLTCVESPNTPDPLIDVVQSRLAQNSSNLLTAFQDAFNIDVYRRYRLSEKLKLERQLFPKCIQASAKYYNKRSSHITINDSKENLTPLFYAGEEIGDLNSTTMNTRHNLVQKWLEKVETPVRKPFSDINVNSPLKSNKENSLFTNKNHKLYNNKSYLKKKSKKKLGHNISTSKTKKKDKFSKQLLSPSLLQNDSNKKIFNENKPSTISDKSNKNQFHSIVDHIDTFVIEDSQTQVVDKDHNAWLQVVKAHNTDSGYDMNEPSNSTVQKIYSKNEMYAGHTRKNVYFYKKSFLFKSCSFCLNSDKMIGLQNQRLNSNDISITINTNNVLTRVTVVRNDDNYVDKEISKLSVETQTEECKNTNAGDHSQITSIPSHQKIDILSQDLFVDNCEESERHDIDTNKNSSSHCLLISDSDSDTDIDCSGPIKVTAEVHKSCDMDHGVLCLLNNADNQSRVTRSARRRTVDSNNSSEKENVEPNRAKKPRQGKKQGLKK